LELLKLKIANCKWKNPIVETAVMSATAKRSGKRGRIRKQSRLWRRSGLLLVSAALVVAAAGFIWHRIATTRSVATAVPIIKLPEIELGGLDPAVIRAIEKARADVEQSPRSARAWGQLGKVLLAHDIHIPASTCLAQAERLDPAQERSPYLQFYLKIVYGPKAMLDPAQARWPYLQGLALIAADPPDPGAAIEKFQRAVELGGDTPQTLRLRLGEALLGQDRLEEAEQQFLRILQLDPDNARAHLGLARVAVRRGDPTKSQGHLERILNNPHAKKAARLLLIEVQQRLGKEPSPEELEKATELPEGPAWPDPFWEEALKLKTGMKAQLYRAERLLRQGRIPEALALLQQTAKDYPDSYYAWLMLGRALTKQRSLKSAEQALRTAHKLAPDSAEARFYLGVALFYQRDYREAEELFRGATEMKPNFAAAHYNLGHCLLHKGDRAGAMESFRVALRCKADYSDAHTMVSELLLSDGHRAEAFAHARLALQFNPSDVTAKKIVQRLLMQLPVPTGP
jgi:tetratricopeptide (TPR) repeat protein